MNRIAKHPWPSASARLGTLASFLVVVAVGCGGDGGSPTDGSADGRGGSGGGRAGADGGVAGRGGTTGAAGRGGTTGAAGVGGTTGAAGVGGTTGAAGVGGTTGAAGVGGTTGSAGVGGTTGAAGAGGAAATDGGAGAGGAAGTDAGPGDGSTDAPGDRPTDGATDVPAGAANGSACAMSSDCASGFCVDGVCCESACSGVCAACTTAKTTQANGLCRPIPGGSDPDSECTQAAESTCGLDGQCNGAGACRQWGTSTICVAESCTGSTHTPARLCNGSGTCQPATATSCGAFLCGATACRTSCSSDSDCTSGNFCIGSTCGPRKSLGASCAGAAECASGHCVDGFCCDSACAGTCAACANAKTGLADGLCRPVSAGIDPDSECAQSAGSTCGLDGTCDGAGACRRWTAGTTCYPESCTGTTHTPARTCDGAGTCRTSTDTSCGAYVCGATACKTSCASGADCTPGNVCAGGSCVPPKAQGAACTAAGDCASGNCVDGVCCESACAGGCAACASAKTGANDGLCRPVTVGTDPDNECAGEAAATCGFDGTCDGVGACRRWAAGTTCAAASCTGSTLTPASACNGTGTCVAPASTSCGQFMCGASGCATSCGSNADCTTGNYCAAGACIPKEANGLACSSADSCASGFCVDGVCCNSACGGTCQTCSLVGSPGICSFADPGTNPRNECTASAASTCGDDGFCDGAGACRKHVAGTVCQAAACASGAVSAPSTCNGTGTCTAGASTSCNGYQCDAAGLACRTGCATDAECTGFCSAGACYASPVNLAGNGDVEYGVGTGWGLNGAGSLVLQNATAAPPDPVHGGTYALANTMRTAGYNGPAYTLPTGAGIYQISLWAMQNENPTMTAAVQVNLSCGATEMTFFPTVGTFGFSLPQGVWTQMTGTVDLSANAPCQPDAATPGVIRSARLYLNQTGAAGTPVAYPNLYVDDVVVRATGGQNLVGNPNFETGVTDGWQNNGGGTLATTTTVFRTGAAALGLTGRTGTYNGPRWNLPLGAAKYNVTVQALHAGALPHDLILQPTYTCLGGSAQYPAPIATAPQVGGNGWNTLSGTVTFPPAGAAAGCKLTSAGIYLQQEGGTCGSGAGQIECPDLFVDDVSITLAP